MHEAEFLGGYPTQKACKSPTHAHKLVCLPSRRSREPACAEEHSRWPAVLPGNVARHGASFLSWWDLRDRSTCAWALLVQLGTWRGEGSQEKRCDMCMKER